MTSRPNVLTTVTVRAPAIRFPIWIPLLSAGLWALTVLVGVVITCLPAEVLRRRLGDQVAVSPRRLGWQVIRLASILLWSGSFVLVDVRVPAEGVRVCIRTF